MLFQKDKILILFILILEYYSTLVTKKANLKTSELLEFYSILILEFYSILVTKKASLKTSELS